MIKMSAGSVRRAGWCKKGRLAGPAAEHDHRLAQQKDPLRRRYPPRVGQTVQV